MADYRITMTDEEKRLWRRAAKADGGQPLASWIRSRLNAAAIAELDIAEGPDHDQSNGKRS